jgi:hypothetical protein
MPCGLVRKDLNLTGVSFRNGSPITLPHDFGNPVNWTPNPAHFGNPVPPTDPSFNSNPVNWIVNPAHFGNLIGPVGNFLLLADNTLILLTNGTGILISQ